MASTGQGSLSNQQRNEVPVIPPPGPPFVLNSAFNGLSVDAVTGQIVLGQDVGAAGNPAALVSNREIPMNGFWLAIGPAATPALYLDQTLQQYSIGDVGLGNFGTYINILDLLNKVTVFSNFGNAYLDIDKGNNLYQLGDINGSNTGTMLELDDGVQLSRITSASGNRLFLDAANGLYQLGDIDNFGNSWTCHIDDTIQEAALGDTFGVSTGTSFYISVAGPTFQMYDNGGDYFVIGNTNLGVNPRDYRFGDISAQHNGTALIMDDSLQTALIRSNATQDSFFSIDVPNDLYQLGDIGGVSVGDYLQIDASSTFRFKNDVLGSQTINADNTTGLVSIGDTSGAFGGMRLNVDGTNNITNIPVAGNNYFHFDVPNQLYRLGDITAGSPGNNVFLSIDDGATRISTNGFNQMIGTTTAYANGAAAAAGTLLNAPVAGDPTKWITINDAGVLRQIPAW